MTKMAHKLILITCTRCHEDDSHHEHGSYYEDGSYYDKAIKRK